MSVRNELETVEIIDETGNVYQLEFKCLYETNMYGQDADGNRGEKRTEMVDTELLSAQLNDDEIDINKVPKDIIEKAEREVW